MKGLSLFIVLVALVQWSTGYSAYGRLSSYGGQGSYGSGSYAYGSSGTGYNSGSSYGSASNYGSGSGYGSGYVSGSGYNSGSYGSRHCDGTSCSFGGSNSAYTSSQTSSSTSSSSGSSASYSTCCALNSWAQQYLTEIREFSARLRQEYNSMSTGSGHGYSSTYTPWSERIISLTGKTSGELDAICRLQAEELLNDKRSGVLSYQLIAQPNFFDWKSAEALYRYYAVDNGQQQTLDLGYKPVDLSGFDDVKTYSYPTEVKVIDGKTYVVHKNVTEAHKSSGTGTLDNPYVTVIKRNRTIIANGPAGVYNTANLGYNTGAYVVPSGAGYTAGSGGVSYGPAGTTTTVTRKKTVYDWANQNMEPSVIGYRPSVNLETSSYTRPPVHIPVETYGSDVETFNTGYRPSYGPGSTVTVQRVNKTIIKDHTGTRVSGSESHKKWVDGKLVYDTERPFGEWSVPRDEDWKREERERFFWFLTAGNATPHSLEAWERQQEERLLGLAERHHCSLEDIQKFHRTELERYQILLAQYNSQTEEPSDWKRKERGRLDWLIHQNSVTRDELERWQRENADKLNQLARQYHIPVQDLKNWQIEELDRLYVYFNDQNNSMIALPTDNFVRSSEQARLEELIRQHNATIDQLHNSIKMDQEKLKDISKVYKGNVEEMEKWLKGELARLGGIITETREEMTRITEWQKSERARLENMVKLHQGSVTDIDQQMAKDRVYLQNLANKYHVSIDELEKWQRQELERLQNEGQMQIEKGIKEWQLREHENLKKLIARNDLTIEEFQTQIINDRQRMENLARTYHVQIAEIETWLKSEMSQLKNEGFLSEVKKELEDWQKKERERLMLIVQQSGATVQDLELKIKADQSHLNQLAANYNVQVKEIEDWLKNELMRLQSQGLVKPENLQEWQKAERNEIFKLIENNRVTIEEFENKLLNDRRKLADLARTYNVQIHEIETWIKKEGERLQSLGLIQIKEQLNNWQTIERERLMKLLQENNYSIKELEEKLKKDQTHLYATANQHQVRVEEIEEWLKKEIKRLQDEGMLEIEKLKSWQLEWRGNLTNMIKERDFTVEQFHTWLMDDRKRLEALAMQHNVQIEEIEEWVKNEEQRFISMGLLKPNEKLTNWQEVERRYLERITQEQYHSTEQLEQRLRQDRELLEKLARDYQVQVAEIESWMKKELARLRDEGQLQIDNLTSWQIAEKERLDRLLKQNKNWSVEEFESVLKQDREHMQNTAFQYHVSVEEIEKWIQGEVDRLQQQGKLNIEKMTQWQKDQYQRIMNLLQQQSSITAEEFETKIQNDRRFLMNLAKQYNVNINEVETYVKKVIEELKEKGKFEIEQLKGWQLVERDYIRNLITQYKNSLSTEEYERKLRNDRDHLKQLSDYYQVSVKEIEEWMIRELQRLRKDSSDQIAKLAAWQQQELERLKQLIKENNKLNYIQFEVELKKQQDHIRRLSQQYSVSVEEVEQWLREQLLNLKTTGQVQVENLSKWQEDEQKRLIALCLQQQREISNEEFERQLAKDRARIEKLSMDYNLSVQEIEQWMKDELKRLKDSGLVQLEQLSYWQKIERERLLDWLKQQNSLTTAEDLDGFIRRDKERLERIAQDYHVTVEEIESWIEQEGARLQMLGVIHGPGTYSHTVDRQWNVTTNYPSYVPATPATPSTWDKYNTEEVWKEQTKAHLVAVAQGRPMSWQEFEKYLRDERPRLEQYARQFHVTVEEIETWLRSVAQQLTKEGYIHGKTTVEEWETVEYNYLQQLLNQQPQGQQWSYEELERQLLNDRQHLQQLANQYHLNVEDIINWYRLELQKLLNDRRLVSENLTQWQKDQKDRIYQLVKQKPYQSYSQWESELLRDQTTLNRICDQYHVTIEEVEIWIRRELQRLLNLGLIRNTQTSTNSSGSSSGSGKNWQDEERRRLRAIASEISITEEEFLEFIASDDAFQQHLTRIYGCSLEELVPFQNIEIGKMNREGLLDRTQLLKVEPWQKAERDRLYSFIKDKSYTLENLKNWQKQETAFTRLASHYGITTQTLKEWQLEEFERLINLAHFYQMNLNQLQDFREKELRYLTYVMHKKTSSAEEQNRWAHSEMARMNVLQRKVNLSGEQLKQWRRRLYLLAQARLPFSYGGSGGHAYGELPTNSTGYYPKISKDRGDQPPNVYDEQMDPNEPGVAGKDPLYPPPAAQLHNDGNGQYSSHYNTAMSGGSGSASRYSKKEYEYTRPGYGGHYSMQADADFGQQQQVEELNDFGQQQQQQDVEVEDLTGTFTSHQSPYYHNNNHRQAQNEKQVMAEHTAQIEVQAETEKPGFFSNIKNKIFG
ncbi:tiggrin [Musca domestica]|uniref:Tiggrin n=1 Tax=Musca domestica TaxID=7370 RepID=A0A1I8MTC4_MUSDO|nr:tiggrin [Musca domestica]